LVLPTPFLQYGTLLSTNNFARKSKIMKSNRRIFLARSLSAVASSGALARNVSGESTGEVSRDARFVHHVFFWLRDDAGKSSYAGVLKALKALKSVKGVKFLHIGAPSISDIDFEARATDATYTFSYLALFSSKADKEEYLKDPLHTQFFNNFKDVIARVTIYDSLEIS